MFFLPGQRFKSAPAIQSADEFGHQSGGDRQLPVDRLDRLAPGLEPEEIIHRPGHQKPAAEINERRWNLRQWHVGLEVIAGADDQSEAYRPDDLADAAEAVGRTHA